MILCATSVFSVSLWLTWLTAITHDRDTKTTEVAQRNHRTLATALWSERTHGASGSPSERQERFPCAGRSDLQTAKTFRHDALDRLSDQSLDCFHRQLIDRRNDRDCFALFTRPACSTNSVYVVFRRSRHVVVDDV